MLHKPDRPLRIWLLTDVFPPHSGGSGWSTFYLAKALAERGHIVRVLHPTYGEGPARAGMRHVKYREVEVDELVVPIPPAWIRHTAARKAWAQRSAKRLMARRSLALVRKGNADVLHGQHAVSALAACRAITRARQSGLSGVSVATVRDYWPLCPESTRLLCNSDGTCGECVDCHQLMDYVKSAGRRGGVVSLPLAVLRWGRTLAISRELAQCDSVVAVSDYVRSEFVRSQRVPADKVVTIPNLVDLPSVDRAVQGDWPLHDLSPDSSFLLFVGKLDANKGAQLLPAAVARSGVRLPVVVAGEGPLQAKVQEEAATRGLDFRFTSWLDNDQVLVLMQRSRALLFPSAWQEPLSRVLLEGCAAGAAIVALRTGGTGDILEHGKSGWLSDDLAGFAKGIERVAENSDLNARLRSGARRRAEQRFSADKVSGEVEALYLRLVGEVG